MGPYVCDDVWVQGVALTTVGNQCIVGREEGSLVRIAVELGAPELEVDGGCAVAKVGVG